MHRMQHQITIHEIAPLPQGLFEVVVTGSDSSTTHMVHVDAAFLGELGLQQTSEGDPVAAGEIVDLLRRSFEFLLRREPKEAILHEFNLRDIQKYFPEYPGELP